MTSDNGPVDTAANLSDYVGVLRAQAAEKMRQGRHDVGAQRAADNVFRVTEVFDIVGGLESFLTQARLTRDGEVFRVIDAAVRLAARAAAIRLLAGLELEPAQDEGPVRVEELVRVDRPARAEEPISVARPAPVRRAALTPVQKPVSPRATTAAEAEARIDGWMARVLAFVAAGPEAGVTCSEIHNLLWGARQFPGRAYPPGYFRLGDVLKRAVRRKLLRRVGTKHKNFLYRLTVAGRTWLERYQALARVAVGDEAGEESGVLEPFDLAPSPRPARRAAGEHLSPRGREQMLRVLRLLADGDAKHTLSAREAKVKLWGAPQFAAGERPADLFDVSERLHTAMKTGLVRRTEHGHGRSRFALTGRGRKWLKKHAGAEEVPAGGPDR